MSLTFPNPKRSYDPNNRRIRFWGHDGALEVQFFLEENAIFVLFPETENTEAGILAAFDSAREAIIAVALKLYAPDDRRSFYNITSNRFARLAPL
jgi:hypothetical protein